MHDQPLYSCQHELIQNMQITREDGDTRKLTL